jgi:hypothetical protein
LTSKARKKQRCKDKKLLQRGKEAEIQRKILNAKMQRGKDAKQRDRGIQKRT